MGTITKALNLLNHFCTAKPQISLPEFVKLSGFNKATTHRLLMELVANGFLDQNPSNKAFRLGPAVLRLANVREATFPARQAVLHTLDALVDAVGETVHVSQLEGLALSTIAHKESTQHSTRVHLDVGERLPLHATASGAVVLAFSPPALLDEVLTSTLSVYTSHTITQPKALAQHVEHCRKQGFGYSNQGYEEEVSGFAAPLFDQEAKCIGAVAIATPTSRAKDEYLATMRAELMQAAERITLAWGGVLPPTLRQLWETT